MAAALIGRYVINKREAKKCPISTDTENSENVYVSLEYLKDESNSDRVYIMQFHNGGHYISGKSQQKFSCTHEICAKGISRECELSQNHLVSNYNLYIKSLLRDGSFSHINIDTIKDKSFKKKEWIP